MFLNNYNSLIVAPITGESTLVYNNVGLTGINGNTYAAKAADGTSVSVRVPNVKSLLSNILTSFNDVSTGVSDSKVHQGIIFGSGSVPASASDTALSGNVVSNVTFSDPVITSKIENGKVIFTAGYLINNTSGETVTIGEVALVSSFYWEASSSLFSKTYYIEDFLVERSALPSPLVMANGEVGQITYTIEVPVAVI